MAFLEKFCHLDHGPAKKFVFFFENKKNTNSIEIFFGGYSSRIIWELYRGQDAKHYGTCGFAITMSIIRTLRDAMVTITLPSGLVPTPSETLGVEPS